MNFKDSQDKVAQAHGYDSWAAIKWFELDQRFQYDKRVGKSYDILLEEAVELHTHSVVTDALQSVVFKVKAQDLTVSFDINEKVVVISRNDDPADVKYTAFDFKGPSQDGGGSVDPLQFNGPIGPVETVDLSLESPNVNPVDVAVSVLDAVSSTNGDLGVSAALSLTMSTEEVKPKRGKK